MLYHVQGARRPWISMQAMKRELLTAKPAVHDALPGTACCWVWQLQAARLSTSMHCGRCGVVDRITENSHMPRCTMLQHCTLWHIIATVGQEANYGRCGVRIVCTIR